MGTATKANEFGVKVGDFFTCSWGWDQTNVDFYRVVRTTPKGVYVQQWTNARAADDSGWNDSVVPGDGPRIGCWVPDPGGLGRRYDPDAEYPVKFHRTQSYTRRDGSREIYFAARSFANAYLWDGKSKYETPAGFGH